MPKQRCARCNDMEWREMDAEMAANLFWRLRQFLAVREPWGCYVPNRNGGNNHRQWPLHYWPIPGRGPLVIEWSPARDADHKEPTFEQFCCAYGIRPIEREGLQHA